MNPQNNPHRKSNREIILNCIVELYESGDQASRVKVTQRTGIRRQIVDETIKTLKEEEIIWAPVSGYYEPKDLTLDRIISATHLPRGRVKVEIGDELVTFTPREVLTLAKLLCGHLVANGALFRS